MDIDKYNKSFCNREYVKGRGNETEYYILTLKVANADYKLTLLRSHNTIFESCFEGLTLSKYGAFEWLLNYDSSIFDHNKVTMVHYVENRKNGKPSWEKETNNNLKKNLKLYMERHIPKTQSKEYVKKFNLIKQDIEAELAEEDDFYTDGMVKEYYGKRYERNPLNRAKALEIHGLNCFVCKFNFEKTYGERGKDFIEVHHVNPLSTIREEVIINPKTDLVPVCSNCHRMIHRKKDEVLSIEQMKAILKL